MQTCKTELSATRLNRVRSMLTSYVCMIRRSLETVFITNVTGQSYKEKTHLKQCLQIAFCTMYTISATTEFGSC